MVTDPERVSAEAGMANNAAQATSATSNLFIDGFSMKAGNKFPRILID
jgi:hypothetical protein